ncbi:GntR family transcriptional regulator [Nonomuraea sp. MTCD27]|uniref:GntR family transcriptional regulator n=1 Tax=Nonomuraea sp. MTCD27 TaxID=1676747 RepID=UPI0035C24A51
MRDAIRAGRLRPGVRLPLSRALAADLRITRGVVIAAYHQFTAEGGKRVASGCSSALHCELSLEGVP